MRELAKERLLQQIKDQKAWIEANDGMKGDENCYGDGGFAIYAAVIKELRRLEKFLTIS